MAGFQCSTCGEFHEELPMSLGAPAPALWYSIPEADRERRAELSSEQCVVDDEHFFLLGRLLLPVTDGPESFAWLAWVSLSEENFIRASDLWETAGRENEPENFGWLQSALPYEPSTLNLKTMVQTQPVGERPTIRLDLTDHPLYIEQQQGVSMGRVKEIVEVALHASST